VDENRKFVMYAMIITILILIFPLKIIASQLAESAKDIEVFNGDWYSGRSVPDQNPIHQTLSIQCDNDQRYCTVSLSAENSRTCSERFGEPTDALLEGGSAVELEGSMIELTLDAYCKTIPPTFTSVVVISFTYNKADNTLIDNLNTTWYPTSVKE